LKKRYFLALALLIIGFASCSKKSTTPFDPAKQAAADQATIQAYITSHKLDSVQSGGDGLYYKIITPGTGTYPGVNSTITVNYTGSLANGSVFAPTSPATAILGSFIEGWQLGIPHINAGGTILLLIPSALGYGDNSPAPSIPVNSVLIFTVNLVSFN
jgi:FKBP-type peptidyl-prolyl cis-trans isomerase FkpA